jgi:hypothetical protein
MDSEIVSNSSRHCSLYFYSLSSFRQPTSLTTFQLLKAIVERLDRQDATIARELGGRVAELKGTDVEISDNLVLIDENDVSLVLLLIALPCCVTLLLGPPNVCLEHSRQFSNLRLFKVKSRSVMCKC